MSIKIINNQKVDMTEDEYQMFLDICKNYDRANFKGEDLFKDLFITNDDGLIIFIKPPSHKYISMEVFLFVVAIYQHQHMRVLYKRVDDLERKLLNKI